MDSHATESEQLISNEVEDPNYSSLTTSLREMIREFTPLSPDCCIFRASPSDREKHPKAFDLVVVSIGPFHYGKEKLQSMEKLKVGFLDACLSHTNISLETLIQVIKEWENEIRNCYAEKIEFSSDDFVKMILLDSCFILQIICSDLFDDDQLEQLTLPKNLVNDVVHHDFILLENQLPFFVLEGLFNLFFPNSIDTDLLMERISQQQLAEIKHLLDLLRKCQAPTVPRRSSRDSSVHAPMRNATELGKVGIVIKASQNQSSATDIRYTAGVLEIPKVNLSFLSADVLRNLIALEFCLYFEESYISNYIDFLDHLIETGKDVDLLVQNGIFEHAIDTESVATLFNSLQPLIGDTN